MATKKDTDESVSQSEKSANKKKSFFSKISEIISNGSTHRVMSVISFIIAFYLGAIFYDFIFGDGADISIIESRDPGTLLQIESEVKNMGGLGGATIANYLINHLFGLPMVLLVVIFGAACVPKLTMFNISIKKVIWCCLFFIIWGSLFLGHYFKDLYMDSYLYYGGEFGFYTSTLLKAYIGDFGIFLLLSFFLYLFFYVTYPRVISTIRRKIELLIYKITGKEPPAEVLSPVSTEPEHDKDKNNEKPAEPVADNESETETDSQTIETTVEINNDELSTNFDPRYLEDEGKKETYNVSVDEKQKEAVRKPKESGEISFSVKQAEEEETVENEDTENMQMNVNTNPDEYATNMAEPYDPTKELPEYTYPPLDLLKQYPDTHSSATMEELEENKTKIIDILRSFNVVITGIEATVGPTVTLYEVKLDEGILISKIKKLGEDLALRLSTIGVRIVAPMPGRGTVGIEVPNAHPSIVPMYDMIASKTFQEAKMELPMAIGKTISNKVYMRDLAKCPHLIVAGATGQGKSVGLNAILTSLLYRKHPSQLKLVLVDPKMVEFSIYKDIDHHFLAKMKGEEKAIITDMDRVVPTLGSLCIEMDARYELLADASVRNIIEYNSKFINHKLNPASGHKYLPYIVVVIDEFADLIQTAGKKVEGPIQRLAQKARAVGIHLILATQRPSSKVITGEIKANFPVRVAFKTTQSLESHVILDRNGAETLIGRGDLLFSYNSEIERVQCAFVDTPEVEAIDKYIANQQGFPVVYELPEYIDPEAGDIPEKEELVKIDELFDECARLVVQSQRGSVSDFQRRLGIGFSRAGKIMDQLYNANIVGPNIGSKPREVYVHDELELEEVLERIHNR